jgi:ribonuclease M5
MERKKIYEMIVVEGKNDTNTLKSWFDCDTIETNGSALSESTIEKIRLALKKRGVIVFTDPDYPGEKIRKTIDRDVPGCKHAFVNKESASDSRKGKIGIEHAGRIELTAALMAAKPSFSEKETPSNHKEISSSDLQRAGLIAGPLSKTKRELLGKELHIGYTNGKQLYKRLKQFRISYDDFNKALSKVEKELQD